MNICMLLNKDFATDYRVYKEAKTLTKAGHKVIIYTFEKNKISQTTVIEGIINKSTGYKNTFLGKLKGIQKRILLPLKTETDIYHAHDLDTLPYATFVAKIKRKPLIYDAHELATEVAGLSKTKKRILNRIEKYFSKKANLVITANEPRKELFKKRYNLKNIISLENFPEKNTKKPKKETKFTFLYVGILGPGRGLNQIIAAANEIKENFKLKIIGYGTKERELKKLIKTDKIEWKGKIPFTEVQKECQKADVGFLLLENTSLNNYYAAPNKIYDYMQGGCISIVSNLPCLEVVKQENVGIVINVTKEDIEKAMIWCLKNKQKVKEMQEEAYKKAQKTYNWEQQEQKLIQAYETLTH